MKKPAFLLLNKHFIVVTVLVLGIVLGVSVMSQRTQTRQEASGINNLNSAKDIVTTSNEDGTMGPKSAEGNFSNMLPEVYWGKLEMRFKDSQAQENGIILKLTVAKAEAHLVYLSLPGEKITENSRMGDQKTNQNVNKWETLKLSGDDRPITVDFGPGESASLGISELAGGKYSEIRVYVASASARFPDGRTLALTVPGGKSVIRVVNTFNIFAGRTTVLTLDMDQKRSVNESGNASFLLPFITGISTIN